MAELPRLVTITFSHYCEKARWALDRAGIAYREERHVQGIHQVAARRAGGGKTVPVLVTGAGVIAESSDILHWVDARTPPADRLFPDDPQVESLCARFDEVLGGLGRLGLGLARLDQALGRPLGRAQAAEGVERQEGGGYFARHREEEQGQADVVDVGQAQPLREALRDPGIQGGRDAGARGGGHCGQALGQIFGVIVEAGRRAAEAAEATGPASGLGSGGMASKLEAAGIASSAGIGVVVAGATRRDVLKRILAGDDVGTWIPPRGRRRKVRAFTAPAGRSGSCGRSCRDRTWP